MLAHPMQMIISQVHSNMFSFWSQKRSEPVTIPGWLQHLLPADLLSPGATLCAPVNARAHSLCIALQLCPCRAQLLCQAGQPCTLLAAQKQQQQVAAGDVQQLAQHCLLALRCNRHLVQLPVVVALQWRCVKRGRRAVQSRREEAAGTLQQSTTVRYTQAACLNSIWKG